MAGVITKVFDLTGYAESRTGSYKFGITGTASKGPIGEDVVLTSKDDWDDIFGKNPPKSGLGFYAVDQLFEEGAIIVYERIAKNGVASNETFVDTTPTTPVSALTIEALTVGTDGDNILVTLNNISGNTFNLLVYYYGVLVETFALASMLGTDANYIVTATAKSSYIKVTDLLAGVGATLAAVTKTPLTGGDDGCDDLTTADVITALELFEDRIGIDIDYLIAPGYWQIGVTNKLASVVAKRGDASYIGDVPFGLSKQDALKFHNGSLTGNGDYPSAAINHTDGRLYYPWGCIDDNYKGGEIWLSPSIIAARVRAQSVNKTYPWYTPAGVKRGKIGFIKRLEVRITADDVDLFTTGGNCLNPFIKYGIHGFVTFGANTLQRATTDFQSINVDDCMKYIKKILVNTVVINAFDPNDQMTYDAIASQVNPLLEDIKQKRGLYKYTVIIKPSNFDIQNKRIPVKVYVTFVKSGDTIDLNFYATPLGLELAA